MAASVPQRRRGEGHDHYRPACVGVTSRVRRASASSRPSAGSPGPRCHGVIIRPKTSRSLADTPDVPGCAPNVSTRGSARNQLTAPCVPASLHGIVPPCDHARPDLQRQRLHAGGRRFLPGHPSRRRQIGIGRLDRHRSLERSERAPTSCCPRRVHHRAG